jgi:hypothetical protein
MEDKAVSTRERIWAGIIERHPEHERLGVWAVTDLISRIPEQEWQEMHAGSCVSCGEPARLYPGGWFCGTHRTGAP